MNTAMEGNPNQNEKAGSHIIQLSGIEIPEGQILRVLTRWVFNCVFVPPTQFF